jgi:hypothetical protein
MVTKTKTDVIVDESHPTAKALREGKKKVSELGIRRADLEKQLEAEIEKRRRLLSGSREERLGEEADAILDNRNFADSPSIEKLRHQIEVVDFAVQKQQEFVGNHLQAAFSKVVCDDPQNRQTYISKRIAAAIAELAAANEAEKEFFAKLYQVGCSTIPYRPMAVKEVGIASDTNSRAAAHLREVKEFCPEILR